MLEMASLPEPEWQSLNLAFVLIKDWKHAAQLLRGMLARYHACGNGRAVHGDLRGCNIMVRYDVPSFLPPPLQVSPTRLSYTSLATPFYPHHTFN